MRGLHAWHGDPSAVRIIDDFGIRVKPLDVDMLEDCAVLSIRENVAFFGSVFLYRSIVTDLPLLTADGRLANIATRLNVNVVIVEDAS
jgi:predicted nucleic acid-binding protein